MNKLSRDRMLKQCDALMNFAFDLASAPDAEAFVPEPFQPIRDQMNRVQEELVQMKQRLLENQSTGASDSETPFDPETEEPVATLDSIVSRLHKLVSLADDIEIENSEAGQAFVDAFDASLDGQWGESFKETLHTIGLPLATKETTTDCVAEDHARLSSETP